MSELGEAELTEFCEKLKAFKQTLSPGHQELLDAILELAWNATAKEESLLSGFDGCFEPDQAATLTRYKAGEPMGIKSAMVQLGIKPSNMIRGG